MTDLLLPSYGWSHKEAGKKYSKNEKSFRSTTSATQFTNRGFRIVVDRQLNKVRFVFDSSKADRSDSEITAWLDTVEKRVGLGSLNPEPYWGFNDLRDVMGEKVRNCFFVVAESKVERGVEYFSYQSLLILSGYTFEKLLQCLEEGVIQVDFDARTKHNHGTKFRIRQGAWKNLYSDVEKIF